MFFGGFKKKILLNLKAYEVLPSGTSFFVKSESLTGCLKNNNHKKWLMLLHQTVILNMVLFS